MKTQSGKKWLSAFEGEALGHKNNYINSSGSSK